MLATRLLGGATKLAGQVKHVSDQRATAHLVIADLCVLAVLRAQDAQTLAVGAVVGVVKVAKHVVALDSCFELGTEGGLRFVLVEALLHVLDGATRMYLVTARQAVSGQIGFLFVVLV